MGAFLDAALRVMSSRQAMTAIEITEAALQCGLLKTRGLTPQATMTAALYLETKAERPRVRRMFMPGPKRARRNSVPWTLMTAQGAGQPASTAGGPAAVARRAGDRNPEPVAVGVARRPRGSAQRSPHPADRRRSPR
jgi:hypothetical protein